MQATEVLRNGRQQRMAEATAGAETVHTSGTARTRELLKVHQLIDLTDKPIQLAREDIGWSRVRANASNCICCCLNSSITLVTTNASYMLDHIPLEDIQSAEASPNVAHLAMSNRHKLAIIDLVESNISLLSPGPIARGTTDFASKLRTSTKLVNLAGVGVSMADVLLWRWIDEAVLAILTRESLFTCQVDQTRISHHATTALSVSPQLLSIEKVCDLHPSLSALCQISGIQRDQSGNLYAITGLYLPGDYLNRAQGELRTQASQQAGPISVASRRMANFGSSSLKHGFSSVPGRLSQLANNGHSFDSLASVEKYTDLNNNDRTLDRLEATLADEICGLVQIHCRLRARSQVIPAQAATLASSYSSSDTTGPTRSTLIVANRTGDKLRVHFVGMATTSDLTTSGQNAAPSRRMVSPAGEHKFDFPTSIVCCPLERSSSSLTDERASDQLAMVSTKYGQLFVCSIQCATILFNVRIAQDVISSTVLESTTGGLMAICRDGKVILVQVVREKVIQLLEDRSLHLAPSFGTLESFRTAKRAREDDVKRNFSSDGIATEIDSLSINLNVIESTKF